MRWNERGFGFIESLSGGDEIFCHVSEITDGNCLRPGDEVQYKLKYDDRRGSYQAANLTGGEYEDRGGRGRSRN